MINFQIFSTQFGSKIEKPIRHELRDILGIQNIDGIGSYLGMLESLGGSKTQIFGFLLDQLNNRVNRWTFKIFTNGGRGGGYKVSGYCFTKSCNVLLSVFLHHVQ